MLKGIDLEIEKGEVVAVIGSSGTGKSTLLRCMNYLEVPDEGSVTIGDITVTAGKASKKEIHELRKHSAMIFQNYNLFSNKDVLGNVTAGSSRGWLSPALWPRSRRCCFLTSLHLPLTQSGCRRCWK